MSIKLIATDLDGTLMAPDHLTVTKRTYDALKSSHDKGIRLAVATGRSMVLIDNVISQIYLLLIILFIQTVRACMTKMKKKLFTPILYHMKKPKK